MVSGLFGTLLQELGQALEGAEFEPDEQDSCLLVFPDGQRVQMEIDKTGDFLMVASHLGEVPPGGYRRNLFEAALKMNGLPPPQLGTFAFNHASGQLIFLRQLNVKNLNGEQVADFLEKFNEVVLIWKEEIEKGEVPIVETASSGRGRGGLFGLTP